jgi:hypothetical protein
MLTRGSLQRPARRIFVLSVVTLLALTGILAVVPTLIGQAYSFSAAATLESLIWMMKTSIPSLGLPLILLAVAGAPTMLRAGPRWSAMVALFLGGVVFHLVVNVPFQERFFLGFVLPVAAFAAAGFASVWRALQRPTLQFGLVAVLALVAAFSIYSAQRKPDRGYHRFVASLAPPDTNSKVYLVAGNPTDEGAFISEIALASARPDHFVVRASKVLSHSGWAGSDYELLFTTPDAMRGELDRLHAGFIVVQEHFRRPDILLLGRALRSAPGVWMQVPAPAAPSGVSVFRRIGPMPSGPLQIEMETSVGQQLRIRE